MMTCLQEVSVLRSRKWLSDAKYHKICEKMARWRTAKEHKRLSNPVEREPKFEKYYPLEFGILNKRTGEIFWLGLKSVRDVAKRVGIVLKYYKP